jgi:hypothetical protein
MILTVPAAGEIGLIKDAAPQELPPNAWTDARNMRFRDGYAQRIGGHLQVYATPSITPYAVAPFITPASHFWVHLGLAAAFVDDGTTRTDISRTAPFTGTIDDRWMCSSFNGVFIANNGVDHPQFWGGNVANDLANIGAWDATWRCAVMRPFKNFLVALDVTKAGGRYQSMVKWSNPADPGTLPASWDATNPANEAGEIDLAETADALVDALPLGDTLIIYKERSMYAMQPSGDVYIWRFTRISGDFGMLTRGCGASTPVGHVVLTASDVVLHNGGPPKSILTGRMREWLARAIDQVNFKRAFVVANSNTSEVWICFPGNGQTTCTQALIWNWEGDAFGLRDLPNVTDGDFGTALFSAETWDAGIDVATWDSDAATWDSDAVIWKASAETWDADATIWNQTNFSATRANMVMSTNPPMLITLEQSNSFAGAAVAAVLERKHIALGGDTDAVKTIRSIRPRIDGPVGSVVQIEIGASMDAETAPVYAEPISYVLGSTLKADTFASGRFHSVRFSSSGVAPWRIKSYDIDYITQGRY